MGLTANFHLTDVYFTKSSDDGLTWACPDGHHATT